MNYLPLRIWFIVTITLAISATIIRLAWQIPYASTVSTIAISILGILGFLGAYAFLVYFILKPSLKKLKSLPLGIGIAVVTAGGLISGIIHFIRFVPSPEAAVPLSVVIATLFLLAGISAYFLLLWILWSIWKTGKS